jgi:ATP-dependent DNA helicase RecG
VVGTHALIQDAVSFRDLGLVIVDEQHRFGVRQRLALQGKGGDGGRPDMLAMTATPIPRTLALSHYGDMDMSALDEKPAGRQPIATPAVPIERIGEVIDGLKRAIEGGAQVYWVCPLVEDSATLDVAAAEDRHRILVERLGARVALVHGRQKPRERDAAMAAFGAGAADVLVATTVIEVGMDVPNASVMVIEHAERFGLAQLHQLRGRVGRGTKASSCILLYRGPLTDAARARIGILRATEDGFRIAEEDLRLRGAGDALGARQSGLPGFRLAILPDDEELIIEARDAARDAIEADPELATERGAALRALLYLFEREEAVRLIEAG